VRVVHILVPRRDRVRPLLEYAWSAARAVDAEIVCPLPDPRWRAVHNLERRRRGRPPWPADLERHLPPGSVVPFVPLPGRSLDAAAWAVARRLADQPIDVVQGSILDESGYVAVRVARWLGTASVAVAHGTDAANLSRRHRTADRSRWTARWASRLVAVSNHVARPLRALGRDVEVIPYTVFGADFPLRPWPPGPPWRLAFAGRVGPAKGFDVLLAALARIPRRPWMLEVLGPREAGWDPGRHIQASPVAGRIQWRGPRVQSEVAEALARSHALVLPSRAEGLGNVVVEALLTGRPALVAATGGLVEIPGVRTVSGHDPDRWATALSDLMDDLASTRPEGLRRGVEGWTWERQALRMRATYAELSSRENKTQGM
jgi:glycosyltransferase involved in cell wall biosynthesis